MSAMKRREETFIFYLDGSFMQKKSKYDWPYSENISFSYLSDEDAVKINSAGNIKYNYILSKIAAQKAKECNCDRILSFNLICLLPFLPFMLKRGCKVRGIIYRIYLYKKKSSPFRCLVEDIFYKLMVRCKSLDKIFMLNDENSVNVLNKKHRTNKFIFLPDPVPYVDRSKLKDVREELGIHKGDDIYLHFGGLSRRKGTIEILKAIALMEDVQLQGKWFVFAGKVYDDIKEEFYSIADSVNDRANILIFDEFCDYSFLFNLCYTCDVILIPYHDTNLSSGLLGYAALFNKPVVGPSDGLIGSIIKTYNLGLTLREVKSNEIAAAICTQQEGGRNDYANVRSVENFTKVIFE